MLPPPPPSHRPATPPHFNGPSIEGQGSSCGDPGSEKNTRTSYRAIIECKNKLTGALIDMSRKGERKRKKSSRSGWYNCKEHRAGGGSGIAQPIG